MDNPQISPEELFMMLGQREARLYVLERECERLAQMVEALRPQPAPATAPKAARRRRSA